MTAPSPLPARAARQPGRLREMPPFGAPDDVDARSPVEPSPDTDDPRGVYLPPPEAAQSPG